MVFAGIQHEMVVTWGKYLLVGMRARSRELVLQINKAGNGLHPYSRLRSDCFDA